MELSETTRQSPSGENSEIIAENNSETPENNSPAEHDEVFENCTTKTNCVDIDS